MKITVSRYWKLEFLSLILIELIPIVGIPVTLLFFPDDVDFMIYFSICGFIMMTFGQVIIVVASYRFLTHVIYENNIYTSFFWRKKLCVIKENDSLFYAKIHARISTFHYADFVLISTEPFQYHDVPPIRWFPWDPKPIQVSYDVKKMILLPYEENAPYLSKISQWTRIYPRPNI